MKARIDPQIDGTKVEDLRWLKRLTASELARRAGISRQHLTRIRHNGRDASLKVQRAIADVLEVPIEEIQKDQP